MFNQAQRAFHSTKLFMTAQKLIVQSIGQTAKYQMAKW